MATKNCFLIVEDDANDAFFVKRALRSLETCSGSTVCRNVSEAKSYLKGAGMYGDRGAYPLPDIILADLRLGADGSGADLVDWIREQPSPIKEMPVVILTGSTIPADREEAERTCAQGVYTKPCGFDDLRTLLANISDQFSGRRR
jgi:CheY-like chemotaxis protein